MATEMRGKIKERLWVRPVCTDTSESFHLSQRARKDFKQQCWEEEIPIDVAAPDYVDEAFELGDPLGDPGLN